MPNFQTGNFKQKNKKFKNSKSGKSKQFKNIDVKVKKIKKLKDKKTSEKQSQKNIRKNKQKQKLKKVHKQNTFNINWPQELKNFYQQNYDKTKPIKIVLVFALNNYDSNIFVQFLIENYCNVIQNNKQNDLYNFQYPLVELKYKDIPQLKNSDLYYFIPCKRQDDLFLDYCKVADVLINLTTVQYIDFQRINIKPAESMNAIDELGKKCINLVQTQGNLDTMNIIVGFDQIPQQKQKDAKFYFKRQFQLEYPEEKIIFLDRQDQFIKILLQLQSLEGKDISWRDQRGYFLTQQIKVENNTVKISGFVKNSFSLNELIHITGVGDFAPLEMIIDIPQTNSSIKLTPQNQNPFEIFNNTSNLQKIKEDDGEMDEEQGDNELNNINQNLQDLNLFEIENNNEEIKSESEEEEIYNPKDNILQEEKTKEQMKLIQRNDDEKLFDDEVEYEADINVRDRFKKYKYMKSFIQNEWNIYDSLPDYYQRLFVFQNINKIKNRVKKLHQDEIFALENTYITFVLNIDVLEQLKMLNQEQPIIVSNLFKHERKMTLNHCKVKFHNLQEEPLNSKNDYIIHSGFRKYQTNIFFSNIYPNVNKFKYCKKLEVNTNTWFLASFFQQVYFTPCHALIFQKQQEMSDVVGNLGQLVLLGTFLNPDPFKIILKRIILTGYPFKVKKKLGIVRYMFFNPEDIYYFMKNEVYTKKGLKGKIKESLGTHGLFKVQFNGVVKQNDTVCMNLYKRVFPKFIFV